MITRRPIRCAGTRPGERNSLIKVITGQGRARDQPPGSPFRTESGVRSHLPSHWCQVQRAPACAVLLETIRMLWTSVAVCCVFLKCLASYHKSSAAGLPLEMPRHRVTARQVRYEPTVAYTSRMVLDVACFVFGRFLDIPGCGTYENVL